MINITKDNINDIKYRNVVAITYAEAGAMGEEFGFHVVLKDLMHYYVNLGDADFTKEEFYHAFPLMKTFRCFYSRVENLKRGWTCYYMGYGNYFLIRSKYAKKVDKYIKDNFKKNWQDGELYKKWYTMVKDVL